MRTPTGSSNAPAMVSTLLATFLHRVLFSCGNTKLVKEIHTNGLELPLQKWVIFCHSVHGNPESRYICTARQQPVSDFLDAYRMDLQIRAAVKSMATKEREAYLKNYTGWRNDLPDDGDSFFSVNGDIPPF